MRLRLEPTPLAAGLAAAFLLASTLAGCYTVLKHPVAEVSGGGSYSGRNCYECHGNDGPAVAYDPMHAPGFDYYGDAWYGYYAYPWWHRDIWYEDRYGYGGWRDSLGYQIPAEDGSRKILWGRGAATPPPLPPSLTEPSGGPPLGGTPPAGEGSPTTGEGSGPQEGRTMKHPPVPTPPGNPASPPPAAGAPASNPSPPAPTPPVQTPPKDPKKDKGKDKSDVWGRGGNRR